jgi:hypothetical protein
MVIQLHHSNVIPTIVSLLTDPPRTHYIILYIDRRNRGVHHLFHLRDFRGI